MTQIAHVRRFNGTSDYITFTTPAAMIAAFGGVTTAAIIKANADPPDGGFRDILTLQGGTGGQYGFLLENASGAPTPGYVMYMDGGNGFAKDDTYQSSDGWALVGISKPDGNGVSGRTHTYLYGAPGWEHLDVGAGAVNEGPAPAGSPVLRVGTWNGSIEFLSADVAVVAHWHTTELSDAQFETLTDDIASWDALSPTVLWLFNQSSTSTAVEDRTASNADQSAISGTTAVAESGLAFDVGTTSSTAGGHRMLTLGVG